MTTVRAFTRSDPSWDILDSILKGASAIDMSKIPVIDEDDAYLFVLNYGYDLNRPTDRDEIRAIFEEAANFIERHFLQNSDLWEATGEPASPDTAIPEQIRNELNFRQFLLWASDESAPERPWACAILKVMHIMVHIQQGPLYQFFDEAREQILDVVSSVLFFDDNGAPMLAGHGSTTMPLYGFEVKDQKTRDSIIVKLLCKKETVAEEVRDLIGVRFITRTPAEALFVLDTLREQKVIVFPNVIPSRSRNTLIDFDQFRKEYEALASDPEATEKLIQTFSQQPVQNDFSANPSSHRGYHSIHITCRHLVRLRSASSDKEIRFFFPYEIQILDQANYLESKDGDSAHVLYKQRQFASARLRVLGSLLKL